MIVDSKCNKLDEIEVEKSQNFIKNSIIIEDNVKIRNLPTIFWLTCLFTCITYGYLAPFSFISSGFLTDYFFKDMNKKDAQRKAGEYISLPPLISVFAIPFFGWLVDLFGKRAYLTLISSLLGFLGFLSFFFLPVPLPGFIIYGICGSLTSTIVWSILALVVKGDYIVIIIK